jgi:hypothetical protein
MAPRRWKIWRTPYGGSLVTKSIEHHRCELPVALLEADLPHHPPGGECGSNATCIVPCYLLPPRPRTMTENSRGRQGALPGATPRIDSAVADTILVSLNANSDLVSLPPLARSCC